MWLLASHLRPARCLETLRSVAECQTPGILLTNGASTGYEDLPLPNDQWKHVHLDVEKLGAVGATRWLFEQYPNEPWYGGFCDDELVWTPGWDKILIEAAGRDRLAQGFNPDNKGTWPLHNFLCWGGDLVRAVGWWGPPKLWHWYFDATWKTLAQNTGRLITCKDVVTSTRHYVQEPELYDETYRLGESRKDEDQQIFLHWLRTQHPADRKRVDNLTKGA